MKNNRKAIIAVILLLTIINYTRLQNNDGIRLIQFVYIFVIGALSALLLNEIVALFKARRR